MVCALPVLLYVALSLDGVKQFIASRAQTELTSLLGTPVTIGSVDFAPFNRVVLADVEVADSTGTPVLTIGQLGAGISFSETIFHRRPVITYAELIDVSLALSRDSIGAPLNIEPILAALRKEDTGKKSSFDLSVNMIVVRRSRLTYDILDRPAAPDGRFDPSHIDVSGIRADLEAPRISDSIFDVHIKRMAATETSGITLSEMSARVSIGRSEMHIFNPVIGLPHSRIAFDNIVIPSPLADGFGNRLAQSDLRISTLAGSHIDMSDLSPLLPSGVRTDAVFDIDIEASGNPGHIDVERTDVSERISGAFVSVRGSIDGLDRGRDSVYLDISRLNLDLPMPHFVEVLPQFVPSLAASRAKLAPLANLGHLSVVASGTVTSRSLGINGSVTTACGDVDIDATVSRPDRDGPLDIAGNIRILSFDPSTLHPSVRELTDVSLMVTGDISIYPSRKLDGLVELIAPEIVWKGDTYKDIAAEMRFTPGHVDFQADSRAPRLDFALSGGHDLGTDTPSTELFAEIRNLDLSQFVTKGTFKDCSLSCSVDASAIGSNPDNITGWVNISDLTLDIPERGFFEAGDIDIDMSVADSLRILTVESRILDLSLEGDYTFASLGRDSRDIASRLFPALVPPAMHPEAAGSDARLEIEIHPDTLMSALLRLPVDVIQTATLRATTHGERFDMNIDMPYLRQKNKLIEGTSLTLAADAPSGLTTLLATTTMPTKNGPMTISVLSNGVTDSLDTRVKWKIDRDRDYSGEFAIGTTFTRTDDGSLLTRMNMHRSELVFNDTVWTVRPSVIEIAPQLITVRDFGGYRSGQSLSVNGTASPDSLSRVVVSLDHIDLDYVFETLAISDAVVFGGTATGQLYGDGLLSGSPVLYTPGLHVDGLSYNHCVMGNGDILSWWDNNSKTVTIKADVTGEGGACSKIDGYIRPATEELVFDFKADDAPVGFMLPFMSAFTSEISGRVSGNAHLFGTFKDLDLTGKIFVDNLKMKLDFTNTTYTVSDSVRLEPGHITFDDVTLADCYGNTARLSGEVNHVYFHDPTFLFNITEAKDLLVYDVAESDTADPWFGRIFGRGGARVYGVPGRIDIGVNMTTAPGSTFTFVLSDAEESVDYDFITFHDRDKARKDSIAALDPTPLIVRQLRDRSNNIDQGPESQYVMDFNVDIRPDATLNLVMDPIGGDKIVAHGSGFLNMKYDSQGELEMRGDYTLNNGFYRFTLQDIVIKDFTIRDGSSIRFSGDPYSAQFNITAAHSTTANLTDLDQSFQSDPELNRTNVKVNTIMKIKGDMRSPEIGYDLEFPTLNSDIDRKVKSIISTDEMMGQQIIYLLALNRFYTPEYMSATHGNELVSVASSTLSSRLGSMLGALSDDLSIAPAIRSSKGDFSDVEVDVALSSQLLDNRLLLNGNFGYRDKSLNNNSFIGDFDIRYLLNRAGTIQLKAYNRYNDQNYYLKSALTTQGIGVVFKRDFDNVFSFLRNLRRKTGEKTGDTDEKSIVPADTITNPTPAPSENDL